MDDLTALRVSSPSVIVDTGSGSVEIELLAYGDGVINIDTGFGSIRIVRGGP